MYRHLFLNIAERFVDALLRRRVTRVWRASVFRLRTNDLRVPPIRRGRIIPFEIIFNFDSVQPSLSGNTCFLVYRPARVRRTPRAPRRVPRTRVILFLRVTQGLFLRFGRRQALWRQIVYKN